MDHGENLCSVQDCCCRHAGCGYVCTHISLKIVVVGMQVVVMGVHI